MAITISYPKAQVVVPAPKPLRAVVTDSSRESRDSSRESRVSHATKDPTAAVRRARWRKKNPEQHATQQRAARARRQAGKAGGS